jgi:hypothetical protein
MATRSGKMSAVEEQLLRRILTSRQFAHADTLKRILLFLVDQSLDPGAPAPKEYDIALRAMGRPESFDPRTDPVVRVSLGSVRERLESFFGTEGHGEPLRLCIPKGQYRVIFSEAPADPRPPLSPGRALSRFWRPYFSTSAANIIVYTEPLFFRDGHGRFFRDWNVNQPPADPSEILRRFPGSDPAEIRPVYHYLSAGEMHCMLSLTRMFHEMDVAVETRNSRNAGWQELSRGNLVLLGSPRTNQFLESLQGEEPLTVRAGSIERKRGSRGSPRSFTGRRFTDGRLQRMTEYAVVTRRPGLVAGSSVTMIAANHGRAIEAAGHMLTLEDKVSALLDRMRVARAAPVPPAFQLLIQVETIDIEDEVTSAECIEHHVLRG